MSNQEIDHFIRKSLNIRTLEKDTFGEVFTPPELIHELLDNLPEDVWSRTDTRWLDPAAGRGNFSAIVYGRLMKSLTNAIPSVQERKTHILEKMLYMVELNPDNVRFLRRWFGPRAHIIEGDFLENAWTDQMNTDKPAKFHVILGNPHFK